MSFIFGWSQNGQIWCFMICPFLGVHMFSVPARMCLQQAWGPGSLGVVAVRGIPGWQDW